MVHQKRCVSVTTFVHRLLRSQPTSCDRKTPFRPRTLLWQESVKYLLKGMDDIVLVPLREAGGYR